MGAMPVLREPPCTIADSERLLGMVAEKSKIPAKLAIETDHQCNVEVNGETTMSMLGGGGLGKSLRHLFQQTDGKGDRHWPFT
jgi:hypothetical protein